MKNLTRKLKNRNFLARKWDGCERQSHPCLESVSCHIFFLLITWTAVEDIHNPALWLTSTQCALHPGKKTHHRNVDRPLTASHLWRARRKLRRVRRKWPTMLMYENSSKYMQFWGFSLEKRPVFIPGIRKSTLKHTPCFRRFLTIKRKHWPLSTETDLKGTVRAQILM